MDDQVNDDKSTVHDRAVLLWLHAMSLLTTRYVQLMMRLLATRRRHRQTMLAVDHSPLSVTRTGCHLAAHIRSQQFFGRRRSIWQKERLSTFWEDRVRNHFTSNDWNKHFRMGEKSFRILCDLVEPYMQPKDNPVRNVVPTDKRIAMAIYKLANCSVKCRIIADLFGVHKATLAGYVYRFCDALVDMQDFFIRLPNVEDAVEISQRIEQKCGLPQLFGAIGTTHVPIVLSKQVDSTDFLTSRRWPAYILQAVVDDRHLFRSISCTVPGSATNIEALEEMNIYQNPESLPKKPKDVCGQEIPLLLAGDQSYQSSSWLLTKYHVSSGPNQTSFNKRLDMVTELPQNAFRRLKGRWNILCSPIEVTSDKVPKIITASCCLHNFCEIQDEPYSIEWETNVTDFFVPLLSLGAMTGGHDLHEANDYRIALMSNLEGDGPRR